MNQALIAASIANIMPAAIATGLFVSLATFQRPSGVFDAGGAPDGLYADVAGLVGIACMKASPIVTTVQATQDRNQPTITSDGPWHLLLDDLYAAVEDGWRGEGDTGPWRVVVDGVDYLICGVERDSQNQMTRLEVKLVTI